VPDKNQSGTFLDEFKGSDLYDARLMTPVDSPALAAIKQRDIQSNSLQFYPTYYDNLPVVRDWSTETAVTSGYKISSSVFSCVNKYMQALASVPWKTQTKTVDGLWEDNADCELAELIDKPNPVKNFTWQFYMQLVVAHKLLGGNAIFFKARGGVGNKVRQLWLMPPDSVQPIRDDREWLSGYSYSVSGASTVEYRAEDVIHLMKPNPADFLWGIGNLQAGAKVVDTEILAIDWSRQSFANRVAPDLLISINREITKEQHMDMQRQLQQAYTQAQNARRPMIIGADTKVEKLSSSPQEIDFVASRELTLDEVCQIFDVPPPLVQRFAHATLANIETARKIFWLDTIVPELVQIQSGLNRSFIDDFPGQRVVYDVSGVEAIQSIQKDKTTIASAHFSMGVPFNAINERLGLGYQDLIGGDVGYLPFNLAPTTTMLDADLGALDDAVENRLEADGEDSESDSSDTTSDVIDKAALAIKEVVRKAANVDGRMEVKAKKLDAVRASNAALAKSIERMQDPIRDELKSLRSLYDPEKAELAIANGRDVYTASIPVDLFERNLTGMFEVQHGLAAADGASVGIYQYSKDMVQRFQFDNLNPAITKFVQERTGSLVKYISEETRDGIREAVNLGKIHAVDIAFGYSPYHVVPEKGLPDLSDPKNPDRALGCRVLNSMADRHRETTGIDGRILLHQARPVGM